MLRNILSLLALGLFVAPAPICILLWHKKRLTVRGMALIFTGNYWALSLLLGYLISLKFALVSSAIALLLGVVMLLGGWWRRELWKQQGVEW